MGSPLFDIRKSHLLITELLTNFGRKTEELNRLKTSIDVAWNEIRFGLSKVVRVKCQKNDQSTKMAENR